MSKLRRDVGLLGATSMGIANIIGAGIFVLSGVGAGLAGPSVILSFLIAGVIALLTALSSAELSSFITETGASYAYAKRAFGLFWSFLNGWFRYFDYVIGAATVAVGFAAYFTELFGLNGSLPLLLSAIGVPIVFTILNLIGIKETAATVSGMVMIKIFALVLLLLFGGYYLANHFNLANYTPFFPNGFNGTLNGAAIIFFAFLGFNTVNMMSEETKNPQRTIPKALMLAFIVSFVLYMGVAAVEVGIVNWQTLGSSASPLNLIAETVSSNKLFLDFISFAALIATGSVLLSSLVGGARTSFAMGRDRMLPKQFGYISRKFGTPYFSVLFAGAIIVIFSAAFYNNINVIASIVNFGSLFNYLFVHLSLIKLRKVAKRAKRLFKVPLYPFVPIIGAISCIALMLFLSNTAKIASTLYALLGLAFYFFVYKKRIHEL